MSTEAPLSDWEKVSAVQGFLPGGNAAQDADDLRTDAAFDHP